MQWLIFVVDGMIQINSMHKPYLFSIKCKEIPPNGYIMLCDSVFTAGQAGNKRILLCE